MQLSCHLQLMVNCPVLILELQLNAIAANDANCKQSMPASQPITKNVFILKQHNNFHKSMHSQLSTMTLVQKYVTYELAQGLSYLKQSAEMAMSHCQNLPTKQTAADWCSSCSSRQPMMHMPINCCRGTAIGTDWYHSGLMLCQVDCIDFSTLTIL